MELGHHQVIYKTDSKDLFNALEPVEDVNLHVETLALRQILELLSQNWRVNEAWIPRGVNGVTNWLARKGARSPTTIIRVVDRPDVELETILLNDSLLVL